MAAGGKADFEVGKTGQKVLELRCERGWTRAKSIAEILFVMERKGLDYQHINEEWLERLENKRTTKPLSRKMLEVLCEAFDCTPLEQSILMLHADRNILSIQNAKPSKGAEALNYVISHINNEAQEILEQNLGKRPLESLNEQDLFELVFAAIDMVRKHKYR